MFYYFLYFMHDLWIERLILKLKISLFVASLGSSIYLNFLLLWISKEPLENLQALATFNKDTDSIKEGFKAPDKDNQYWSFHLYDGSECWCIFKHWRAYWNLYSVSKKNKKQTIMMIMISMKVDKQIATTQTFFCADPLKNVSRFFYLLDNQFSGVSWNFKKAVRKLLKCR